MVRVSRLPGVERRGVGRLPLELQPQLVDYRLNGIATNQSN